MALVKKNLQRVLEWTEDRKGREVVRQGIDQMLEEVGVINGYVVDVGVFRQDENSNLRKCTVKLTYFGLE